MHRLRISVSCLFLACCVTSNAGDWPHQRGPQQDGNVTPDSKIPTTLPDDPRIVWKIPATDGFAAPIVSGDRVFFHVPPEALHAFDVREQRITEADAVLRNSTYN